MDCPNYCPDFVTGTYITLFGGFLNLINDNLGVD